MRLVRKTTRSAQNAPPCARAAINPVYSCDQHDLTLRLLNSPLSTRTSSLPIVAPAPAELGAHAQTSLPNSCAAPPLLLCSPRVPVFPCPNTYLPTSKIPRLCCSHHSKPAIRAFHSSCASQTPQHCSREGIFSHNHQTRTIAIAHGKHARAHTHTHKYTHTHIDRHTRLSCAATHKEGLAATR